MSEFEVANTANRFLVFRKCVTRRESGFQERSSEFLIGAADMMSAKLVQIARVFNDDGQKRQHPNGLPKA
jgi:hypothetical protein